MHSTANIVNKLRTQLPADLHSCIEPLAAVIADLCADRLSHAEAQDLLRAEAFALLHAYCSLQPLSIHDIGSNFSDNGDLIIVGDISQAKGVAIGHHARAEIFDLHVNIINDPRTIIPDHLRAAEYCPYPGLRPFQEQLASYFFGREEEIAAIIDKTDRSLLAIVGPSGVGKSSLLYAGVFPALHAQYGLTALLNSFRISTTEDVLLELANFLAEKTGLASDIVLQQLQQHDDALLRILQELRSDTCQRIFLVLDQFEELFIGDEPQQKYRRQRILDNLVYVLDHQPQIFLTLLVTMRENIFEHEDYVSRRTLIDTIDKQRYRLGPPSHSQLRQIIERPLTAFNARHKQELHFQEGVVDVIVQDFRGPSVSLPLLQYLLRLLWMEKHYLTHAAYTGIGRLEGAFERHANAIYDDFDGHDKPLVNRVLLSLVRPGIGNEYTRKRIQLDLLPPYSASEDQRATINCIVQRLSSEQGRIISQQRMQGLVYVELTHEIILKQWERLRTLIEMYRERIQQREELLPQAEQWFASHSTKHPAGIADHLYRGSVLRKAHAYIEYPQLRDETDQRIHACYKSSMRYQYRMRLLWGLILLVLLVVTSVGGYQIFSAREQAAQEQQRANEESQRRLGVSLAQNARRQIENSPENGNNLALALALAANRVIFPAADADYLLSAAAYNRPSLTQYIPIASTFSTDAILSSDARQVFGTYCIESTDMGRCQQSRLVYWDVPTGQELRATQWQGEIKNLALSPNMAYAAFVADNCIGSTSQCAPKVVVWDVVQWKEIRHQDMSADSDLFFPNTPIFVNDNLLVQASNYGELQNIVTGRVIKSFQKQDRGEISTTDLAGRYVASGSMDRAYVWEIATGTVIGSMDISSMFGVSTVLSNKANLLLTYACDGSGGAACSIWTVQLWDVSNSTKIFDFNRSRIQDAAFSPDDAYVALAAEDGSVQIYSTRSGVLVYLFNGHTNPIQRVVFSADGSRLMSVSSDGIRIWAFSDAHIATYQLGTKPIIRLSVSSDGNYILAFSAYGNFRIWDTHKQREILNTSAVAGGVLRGDSAVILTTETQEPSAILLNLTAPIDKWSKAIVAPQDNYSIDRTSSYTPLDVSKDGKYLVSGGCFHVGSGGRCAGGHLYLWNLDQGHKELQFEGQKAAPINAVFSPDNKLIVADDCAQGGISDSASCADGQLVLWRVADGTELKRISAHNDWISSLTMSPDGKKVASGSFDGTLRIWELQEANNLAVSLNLNGDNYAVVALAFSSDSKYLLSASRKSDCSADEPECGAGELLLWDTTNGQLVRRLSKLAPQNDAASLYSVAISPDGRYAFAGLSDGRVQQWQIQNHEQLLEGACTNRLVPELTPEQRQQYGVPSDLELCPTNGNSRP